MSILHLCNVFFEWELAGHVPDTLEKAICQDRVCSQLQYLPLTYGRRGEAVLATQIPTAPTPLPVFTFDQKPPCTRLETWGYSLLASRWAKKAQLDYPMPPWDVVKRVNAKTYSFSKSPLPGAHLLFRGDPIEKGALLKSCFGTAGRGLMRSDSPQALPFCQRQWSRGLPVLSEPLVERLVDFSTQWHISEKGQIAYVGATICKTAGLGRHKSNATRQKPPPFLQEHQDCVIRVLEEMAEMGYFGPVGFDAMVYGNQTLQPIVEINARKTMGLVTLTVQNRYDPEKGVELAYIPRRNCLLPNIQIALY